MAELQVDAGREDSGAAGDPASPTAEQTLALAVMLRRLASGPPRTVLDLGSANSENVAFLAALPARLFIADLPHSLAAAPQRAAGAFSTLLATELPDIRERSVHAVFAWDLLNYLEPGQIAGLGSHLARLCAPGAIVFALISTHKEIPDRPRTFRILDREHVLYERSSAGRRTCPRYNEPDLRRVLPGFEVETSYLLRNGMREYLFCREEA